METNVFYEAALAEEKKLTSELQALEAEHQKRRMPLLQKLEAAKQVKAAYSPVDAERQPIRRVLFDEANLTPSNVVRPPEYTSASSHKGRVTEGALILLASGAPMKTPLLLQQLEARGVDFQAKDKLGNLSAILSRDSRFVSDRRNGWSLAQKNPQDVAASAGSSPA